MGPGGCVQCEQDLGELGREGAGVREMQVCLLQKSIHQTLRESEMEKLLSQQGEMLLQV